MGGRGEVKWRSFVPLESSAAAPCQLLDTAPMWG